MTSPTPAIISVVGDATGIDTVFMSPWVPALITGLFAVVTAFGTAAVNFFIQRAHDRSAAAGNAQRDSALAETRLMADSTLAKLNSELKRQTDDATARREYEFDARKRLYTQVRPLMFQLRESCDPACRRIRRIVCGDIRPYPRHLSTSIQRIFSPLSTFQVMQRNLTAVDLSLDSTLKAQYLIAKELASTLHNGPELALAGQPITYTRQAFPNQGRQHLTHAQLQRLTDFMTIEGDDSRKSRPRKQFELDDLFEDENERLIEVSGPFSRMFEGSDPTLTPVLWRILMAQAFLMQILVDLVDRDDGIARSVMPADIAEFNWSVDPSDALFLSQCQAVEEYVRQRCSALGLLATPTVVQPTAGDHARTHSNRLHTPS